MARKHRLLENTCQVCRLIYKLGKCSQVIYAYVPLIKYGRFLKGVMVAPNALQLNPNLLNFYKSLPRLKVKGKMAIASISTFAKSSEMYGFLLSERRYLKRST